MKIRTLNDESKLLHVIGRYENKGSVSFRVIDNDEAPYILEQSEIEIVDPTLPVRWVNVLIEGKLITTFPEFATIDYWENYFNNDEKAVKSYNEIVVPLSEVCICFSHLDKPNRFPWANIRYLLEKKWCSPKIAVDLAVSRLSEGNETPAVIELAGIDPASAEDILTLVDALARLDSFDKSQVLTAGYNWLESVCLKADKEIFADKYRGAIDQL